MQAAALFNSRDLLFIILAIVVYAALEAASRSLEHLGAGLKRSSDMSECMDKDAPILKTLPLYLFTAIAGAANYLLVVRTEPYAHRPRWPNVLLKSLVLGAVTYLCLEAKSFASIRGYPFLHLLLYLITGILITVLTSISIAFLGSLFPQGALSFCTATVPSEAPPSDPSAFGQSPDDELMMM